MTTPSVENCIEYLGPDSGWDKEVVTSAFEAEMAAQAAICRIPILLDAWPADLTEALYRRVAHNLALRALPLGIQASMSDAAVSTNRVGGTDAEVRRLEAPYRRLVVG